MRTPTRTRAAAAALLTIALVAMATPATASEMTSRDDTFVGDAVGAAVSGDVFANDPPIDARMVTAIQLEQKSWCSAAGTTCQPASFPDPVIAPSNLPSSSGVVTADFGELQNPAPGQSLYAVARYTVTLGDGDGDIATSRLTLVSPVAVGQAQPPTPPPTSPQIPLTGVSAATMFSGGLQASSSWPSALIDIPLLSDWAVSEKLRVVGVRIVPGQTVQYAPSAQGPTTPESTGPAPGEAGVLSIGEPTDWSWSATDGPFGPSARGGITMKLPGPSLDGPWEFGPDAGGRFCPGPVAEIKTVVDVDIESTNNRYAPRTYRVPVSTVVSSAPVPAPEGCSPAAADDVVELAPGEQLSVPVLVNDYFLGAPVVELGVQPDGLSAKPLKSGEVVVVADAALVGQTSEIPYGFSDVGGTWKSAAATIRVKVVGPSQTPDPSPTPTPTPVPPTSPSPKPPDARDDLTAATVDEVVVVPVLRNDRFEATASVRVVRSSLPNGVRARVVSRGRVEIVAPRRLAGRTWAFRYELTDDATGLSDTARVEVRMAPVIVAGGDIPMPDSAAKEGVTLAQAASPTASTSPAWWWAAGTGTGTLMFLIVLTSVFRRMRGRRPA